MKKVIVGMSGGIDSSVAAYLLKEQGYEVVGVSLKHLSDEMSNMKNKTCCSLDDINDARIVCFALSIPHYVINLEKEFTKEVITEFLKEYRRGYTPNPCVICNERVKIKALIDLAKKLNFDFVATGHYAKKSDNGLLLFSDSIKDQSYMLYRLKKEDLDMMLFPLENIPKTRVREIARENNIVTHDKKDSQGICFAPNGYIPYLQKVLGDEVKKGNFVDKDGNVVGQHIGYQFYTIGQRRGLGLNLGKPFFVSEIRPETNEIVVGDFEELLIDEIEVINYKLYYKIEELLDKEIIARPRFSSKGLKGKLILKEDLLFFKFNEKTHENSEGQHIVFYLNDELIGGGEIKTKK